MTNYTFKNVGSDTAKAYGSNLDISVKTAINICNKVRGMNADKAIAFLARVERKEEAVPFTRFTDGVGHRPGMASGRYPLKAARAIGDVIKSALSNAANKGLAEELKLIHICAHKAATPMHQGRQRRRVMKRTHIEVVLQEVEVKEKSPKKKSSQQSKSTIPKLETKVESETQSEKVLEEKELSIQTKSPTAEEKSVDEEPEAKQ
ncbi:50S ribosomal protein L22 [Candidatus Woesearchaeota archaeon]|nr:50S ribosomal protein L22 [Candidatus Woesearchaeota archaeon]